VLDVRRERMEFPDLKRTVVSEYERWNAHAVLIEDAAAGQSLLQELRRNTRVPLVAVKADRDKVSRAHAVTATHEAGLVHLPTGQEWRRAFEDELASFPNAPHDDQVDAFVYALSHAINTYAAEKGGTSSSQAVYYNPYGQIGWMAR